MAKKTKKVELSENTDLLIKSPTKEDVNVTDDLNPAEIENNLSGELVPVEGTLTSEQNPADVKQAETPMPTVQPTPTKKIGKVTVTQSFLNSNTMFFPWLHKQGYAIVSRSYDEKKSQMTFVLEGGDLAEVAEDIIPEYNIHITGSRLSITKK